MLPQEVCNASLHRWCCLDGLVNPHKVIDHEIEADRVHVVLQLLAKGIGQSGKPAHAHAPSQVGPLYV